MNFTLQDFVSIESCRFDYAGPSELLQQKIAGVSIDSRTIQPQEIYFALRGENHDGHNFLRQVFEKQAIAAVVEKKWWEKNKSGFENQPILVVDDAMIALQESALSYRKRFNLPVIGLTGTNGKTTVKEMIAAVLSQTGNVCKTEGNLNNHLGLPLTLFALREDHDFAVIEMATNHFGEIARLCEIAQPDYGLITNIGHGHTEFLQDLHGVTQAKMELFETLQPDGVAFKNLDDPMIAKHSPDTKRTVTYGFTPAAEVTAKNLGMDESGCPIMEFRGIEIKINLVGAHNLSNALAAAAVGSEFGIDIENIKSALENIGVPGKRMEILRHNDILILNDSYNANPESTLAALQTLQDIPAKGKKVFVFGDMLELADSAAEHQKIGEALHRFGVELFFAYGPLSAESVRAAHESIPAKHFSEKQDLIARLKNQVGPNDILLVKGSRGMKMEDVIDGLISST